MTEVYPNALLTERSLNQQESLDRIVNSFEGQLTNLNDRIEDAQHNIDKLIERIEAQPDWKMEMKFGSE